MSIRDKKITDAQIKEKGVCAAPDTLTGTAAENKAVFDRLVREIVAPQFNEIVDTFADMEESTTEWSGEEEKRVAAENARAAAETDRASAEIVRRTQETERVNAENERIAAENDRKDAETERQRVESARVTAENARTAAETQRKENESARVEAETARGENESTRQTQENSRILNEAARVSAESARATAETNRAKAEETRTEHENARTAAESARAENESRRVTAETARANAESARSDAETSRAAAEKDRADAETSRASAETQRKANEDARNVWETYDNAKAYKSGNKVVYSGSSYLCIKDSTGNVPTNTTYWRLIAAKGADGKGSGDMLANVYDPQGKSIDMFWYADDVTSRMAGILQDKLASHAGDKSNPHGVTAAQVGADPSGTAADAVKSHNDSATAHKALLDNKQDSLKGKKGKFVGFVSDDVPGAVDAPQGGGSLVTITFASDFVGCAWTMTGGNETFSGTVDSSLTASVNVLGINTTYTVAVTLGGVTYTNEIATGAFFSALSVNVQKFRSTITVTVDSGSTVTCTLGGTTYTKTSTGTAVFAVGKAGTWTITATKDSNTATDTVEITASGQSKALTLVYATVFGVMWDTSNSSTALTRLTPETDPYGYVNKSVTTEPKPAVGTGSGSSPFDEFMPWNGMVKTTISDNIMVFIPAFYVAYKESGTKKYFYISDKATTGFTKHPGSGKYIGRYHMNTSGRSVSGSDAYVNITRATARSKAKSLGAKYHLYDFATYCAIIWLYLIEFADWNCQSKIAMGRVNQNSAVSSGRTDAMVYHTGTGGSGISDGSAACQYRWLENLWGNVFQWVDGLNANGTEAHYCTDPSKYADDTTTGYTKIGTLPASGYIRDLTVTVDGLLIPKTTGGSDSTYIPDYAYSSSGWLVLYVGGSWGIGSLAGLLYFSADSASSNSYSYISARLLCEA